MQNWKLMLSAECKLIWPVSYTTNIKLLSVEKASCITGKLPTVDAAETAEKSCVLNSCTYPSLDPSTNLFPYVNNFMHEIYYNYEPAK